MPAPCDRAMGRPALPSHPFVGDVRASNYTSFRLRPGRNIEKDNKVMPSWAACFTNCRHRRHTRPSAVEDAKVCYSSVTLNTVECASKSHAEHTRIMTKKRRTHCDPHSFRLPVASNVTIWTGANCYSYHSTATYTNATSRGHFWWSLCN